MYIMYFNDKYEVDKKTKKNFGPAFRRLNSYFANLMLNKLYLVNKFNFLTASIYIHAFNHLLNICRTCLLVYENNIPQMFINISKFSILFNFGVQKSSFKLKVCGFRLFS